MNANRKERRSYAAIPKGTSALERNIFGDFKSWIVGLFQRQPELTDRLIEAKLGQEEGGRNKTEAEAEKLESEAEFIRTQTVEKQFDIARKELELESARVDVLDAKLNIIERHFPNLSAQAKEKMKLAILKDSKLADALTAVGEQIALIEMKGGDVEVFSEKGTPQKLQEMLGNSTDEVET